MYSQYRILLFSSNPYDISILKNSIIDIVNRCHLMKCKLIIINDISSFIRNICFHLERYDIYFINSNDKDISPIRLAELLRNAGIKESIVYISDEFNENFCGYKNNILDYMIRPMNQDKLAQLLLYDYRYRFLKSRLLLNKNSNYFYLKLDQIVFVEVANRGIKIHISDFNYLCKLSEKAGLAGDIDLMDRSISYPEKISDFIKRLDPMTFIRCHQSFIINVDKLISIRRYSAVLDDGSKNGVIVDISKRNWEIIKKHVQSKDLADADIKEKILSDPELEAAAGGNLSIEELAKLQ